MNTHFCCTHLGSGLQRFVVSLRGFIILVLIGISVMPSVLLAESTGVTLAVAPPLFQLALTPGETWKSVVRVDNRNDTDLVIVPQVMDFLATGERGAGTFLPPERNTLSSHTLAGWVTIAPEFIRLRAGESIVIPFQIDVPKDADPGGHYAALMFGNDPTLGTDGSSTLAISSVVSSVLLVRIAGDVRDEGHVRELSTDQLFYRTPDVSFTLRFENTGNVHEHPNGTVIVRDMWGNAYPPVVINGKTENLGTVLPGATRKMTFLWQGTPTLWGMGRYTANARLSLGGDDRQVVTGSTAFYVFPIVPFGVLVVFLGGGMLMLRWGLRIYVQYALRLDHGKELHGVEFRSRARRFRMFRTLMHRARAWMSLFQIPLRVFSRDVHSLFFVTTPTGMSFAQRLRHFLFRYRVLCYGILSVILVVGVILLYRVAATHVDRQTHIELLRDDQLSERP